LYKEHIGHSITPYITGTMNEHFLERGKHGQFKLPMSARKKLSYETVSDLTHSYKYIDTLY